MGVAQLFAAWLFEVGGTRNPNDGVYEFEFGPDSQIAKDVLNLPAVQDAIKAARKEVQRLKDKGDPNAPWGGGSGTDFTKPPWHTPVKFHVEQQWISPEMGLCDGLSWKLRHIH